jgi:hypothetical protein
MKEFSPSGVLMSVAKNNRPTQRVTQYSATSGECIVVTRALIFAGSEQTMRTLRRCLLKVSAAALLAILSGCSGSAVEESPFDSYLSGDVHFGSRELRYNLVGGGEVTTSGNPMTALVTFAKGTLTADHDGLKLDNGERLPWPENADTVRVHFNAGRLQIFANGLRVHQAMYSAETP